MNNTYCVILAGGQGLRFWPMSNKTKPKQFLDILGTGQTFLQMTYKRFEQICPKENIIVVANEEHANIVSEQLPMLPKDQVILEPLHRNTSICIAYATNKVKCKNPEAKIIVAPCDQLILQETEFFRQIETAVYYAERNNALLTLGIKPSRPETAYGYIQIGDPDEADNVPNLYRMKTFTEKPNEQMAQVFYDSGEFFWNSGIFVWSVSSIEQAFEKHHPDIYKSFFVDGPSRYNTDSEYSFVKKVYSESKNLSIDYAILEKANNVYVLCSDLGWSDIGTWTSVYNQLNKDNDENVVKGNDVHCYDTKGNIIQSKTDRLVVLNGVKDYIIVDTDDVLMVCKKDNESNIRQFVNDIRSKRADMNI